VVIGDGGVGVVIGEGGVGVDIGDGGVGVDIGEGGVDGVDFGDRGRLVGVGTGVGRRGGERTRFDGGEAMNKFGEDMNFKGTSGTQ
jgi:hypothetical protein